MVAPIFTIFFERRTARTYDRNPREGFPALGKSFFGVRKSGLTFLEIIAAMLILAFAAVPMIGIYWSTATDADLANSAIFAQSAASNILNAALDSVPFDCIQVAGSKITDLDGKNPEDHVAKLVGITSYNVASFLSLLGNSKNDGLGRGELKDERGTIYKTKLFVFPIPGKDSIELDKEISFSYLPRPPFENSVGNTGKSCWFTEDRFVPREVVQLPYDMQVATITQNAKILGIPRSPDGTFTPLKKLLLRIQWHTPRGPPRSLEIFTAKANLSREEGE